MNNDDWSNTTNHSDDWDDGSSNQNYEVKTDEQDEKITLGQISEGIVSLLILGGLIFLGWAFLTSSNKGKISEERHTDYMACVLKNHERLGATFVREYCIKKVYSH